MVDLDKLMSISRLQKLGIVDENGKNTTKEFVDYLEKLDLDPRKKIDVIIYMKDLVKKDLINSKNGVPENVIYFAYLIRDFAGIEVTETDEDLLSMAEALSYLSNKPQSWAHLWKGNAKKKYYSGGTFTEGI